MKLLDLKCSICGETDHAHNAKYCHVCAGKLTTTKNKRLNYRITAILVTVRACFANARDDGITEIVNRCVDDVVGFVKTIFNRISTMLAKAQTSFAETWSSITEDVHSKSRRIKIIVERLRAFVMTTFAKAGDSIVDAWNRVCESVSDTVGWIANKLGRNGDS